MTYSLDKFSKKKAYMQIYDRIKEDIIRGGYPFGSKVPSKRLLALDTGTSVITVEHAYELLCDEGYIEARERRGYFVIYRDEDFSFPGKKQVPAPLMCLQRPAQGAHPVPESSISFGILAKTMRKVLSEKGERILEKSPNHGCNELRSAITSYLARTQGIYIFPEQIIIGSGAEYLYSLLAQLFSGRLFALEDPSYDKIRRVYTSCGISCEFLHLSHDGIDSEALKNTKATVLHITPFNSYPSGITATASKRAEYLRFAGSRDGYIIEDNFDSELTVSTKNESTLFAQSTAGRVIYLNTFTKTVAPSLRAGYMILPRGLLRPFGEKLGFYSCTVPMFEQYVLAELLDSGDFERHIHRIRRAKRKANGK